MYDKIKMVPFILITGMHRSGTSFLARALNLCGVYLGNLDSLISHEWFFGEDNLRGHWENKKFLELGEKTLRYNNGSWDNVPETVIINDEIGKEIKDASNDLLVHSSLAAGYKDPRIILYLDSWMPYLPDDLVVVAIFRHPLKVAESLKKRNNFSYEKSLLLWKIHNERLLQVLEKYDGFLLSFDWPKEKLISELELVCKKLDLPQVDLSKWYAQELLHSDESYDHDYNLPEDIVLLHSKLVARTEDNLIVQFKKTKRNEEKMLEIIQNLLFDMQTQAQYFSNTHKMTQEKLRDINEKIHYAHTVIAEKDKLLDERNHMIIEKNKQLDKLQKEIQQINLVVQEKDKLLDERNHMIIEKNKQLDKLQNK